MVSSPFVAWNGYGADRKARFLINLSRNSEHWPHHGVKMETMPAFALDLEQGDILMSWDFKAGYRYMYLHPAMRDSFLFRYQGTYYRCLALHFGWGPMVLWLTKLLRPVVWFLRARWGYL